MTTNENNCFCTTPEYTIILNQQGPSGRQGEAGQDGFSPIISVATNTRDTYRLLITTADGVITTPNLISEPIPSGGTNGQVLTNFGNDVYGWGALPNATTEAQGVVYLSTDEDFQPDEEGEYDNATACTPQSVVNYINTLNLEPLKNIKDITNGVQIMGLEEVPPTGIFNRGYFQFTSTSTDSNITNTAKVITEFWENGIPIGKIESNFLTDNSVIAGTGINVTKKNAAVEISSATGNLKYSTATSIEYSELTPDPDTIYRLTDTNEVYLGTIKLTGGGNVVAGMYAGIPAGGQNTGYVGTNTVTTYDPPTT